MALFHGRQAPEVQPGDRFVKAGNPLGKVWEVIDLATAVDGILHARLRSCEGGGLITIGAGVLVDPHFWQAVRTGKTAR